MSEISEIISLMPEEISSVLTNTDGTVLNRINEIRIRRDMPVVFVIKNSSYFVDKHGDLYDYCDDGCYVTDSVVFDELFMKLCDYSIYNNLDSLKKGYLTLFNGARVGVASTAVIDSGDVTSVKNVCALNIRIPRQVIGCAKVVLDFLYVNAFPSVIVAGKPNSGKTTLLRDMARMLSDGFNNRYRKVAVIDERNEFAAKKEEFISMDLGANTDVLTYFPKASGIEIATRTLSPEIIICDEISRYEEVESILYAFSSGISFALSVHIGSREDLYSKPIIRTLLETGEFSYIVLLDNYTYIPEIIEAGEILNEIHRTDNGDGFLHGCGITFI